MVSDNRPPGRLQALDDGANRAANKGLRALLAAAALLVIVTLVVIPVFTKGPGILVTGPLNAILGLGFDHNESQMEGWREDLEIDNINAQPPEGCDPDEITTYDAPGNGNVYVSPEGGC